MSKYSSHCLDARGGMRFSIYSTTILFELSLEMGITPLRATVIIYEIKNKNIQNNKEN